MSQNRSSFVTRFFKASCQGSTPVVIIGILASTTAFVVVCWLAITH